MGKHDVFQLSLAGLGNMRVQSCGCWWLRGERVTRALDFSFFAAWLDPWMWGGGAQQCWPVCLRLLAGVVGFSCILMHCPEYWSALSWTGDLFVISGCGTCPVFVVPPPQQGLATQAVCPALEAWFPRGCACSQIQNTYGNESIDSFQIYR